MNDKPCDPKPCEREFNREIIEQALIIIEKDGRSISNLQRKLNIGYTKAIRLLGAVDIELSVKKPNSEEDFCADCEAEPKPDGEKGEKYPTNEDLLRDRIEELKKIIVDQAITICEMSKVFAKRIAELERSDHE